jgi:hypothetical protein
VKWFTAGTVTDTNTYFERSGSPGYHNGKNLIFGSQNLGNVLVFEDGVPFLGSNSDGTCSDRVFEQQGPPKMTYGDDTIFSCYMNLDYAELANFCKPNTNIRA